MKNKKRDDFLYIPEDPLQVLKSYEEQDVFKEVLYTFGNEEIVKENGRFYLANTIYPNVNKEISREMATELWQSYNMKERSAVSISFDNL